MSPKEVLEFAKKNSAKQVDLRFTDIPGLSHTSPIPISQLSEDSFEEGFGIDGSSIRGWAADPRERHAPDARSRRPRTWIRSPTFPPWS